MNSKTVCRILGWVFLVLGSMGLTTGQIGTYLQFNHTEAYISLGLGFVSVLAARRRLRVASATAMGTGLLYLIWAMLGLFFQHPALGTVEPLDGVIHSLAAIWGIGTATLEVLTWRKQDSSLAE